MRNVVIVLLVLGVLVVAGCGPTETPGTTYIGGSQGLKMSFYNGAPPEQIGDGGSDAFDISIELRNEGETEVLRDNMFIELSGFPPNSFGKTLTDLRATIVDETMEARIKNPDETISEPPVLSVDFTNFVYNDVVPGTIQFPIKADICYLYETRVATDICVKKKMNTDRDDDFCKVSSTRSLSSSGAPVQVKNLRQMAAGTDKASFTFDVVNADTGDVFKYNSALPCDRTRTDERKVWVEVNDLVGAGAGDSVTCSGLREGTTNAGFVTLSDEKTPLQVRCVVIFSERNDRVQPFNILLKYKYHESILTNLDVVHNP